MEQEIKNIISHIEYVEHYIKEPHGDDNGEFAIKQLKKAKKLINKYNDYNKSKLNSKMLLEAGFVESGNGFEFGDLDLHITYDGTGNKLSDYMHIRGNYPIVCKYAYQFYNLMNLVSNKSTEHNNIIEVIAAKKLKKI